MIEVTNISRTFKDVQAVKNVSFTAPDGQVTALLGANGAGKTTTMRMMYALLQPATGTVTIDGIDIHQSPERGRSLIGVLPDNRGLYQRLTARENIQYFGKLQGMDKHAIHKRIDELVQRLRMQDCIDRRTEGFSQGQTVKVALARALVHDPQNILLDEPTNGLDVMSTRAVRAFLQEEKQRGKCIVFSSHVMQEVSYVSDTISIIDKGVICTEGTEHSLLQQTGKDNLEDAFVSIVSHDAENGEYV